MSERGTAFVLIPGAGGAAGFWHRVVPLLVEAGHTAVAVELHGENPANGLPEYAAAVRAASSGLGEIVLVGQSMGAFTVPMALTPSVRHLVLLNPMTPVPGETPGEWWEATGQPAAMAEADKLAGRTGGFSVQTHFLHDVPAEAVRPGDDREPAATPFDQRCTFVAWPDLPLRVFAGREDRLFPIDFQRRLTAERLGLELQELPGGHLNALSQPAAVAAALLSVLP